MRLACLPTHSITHTHTCCPTPRCQVRDGLVPLIARLREKGTAPDDAWLKGTYDTDTQVCGRRGEARLRRWQPPPACAWAALLLTLHLNRPTVRGISHTCHARATRVTGQAV
jgi:hypothetical protein